MENNIRIIENAVEYIETHLGEPLDLEQIASQCGYSRYHFHRMFVNITGMTVHTYVTRRRLTEAARLLVSTDRPILDIALSTGYETQRSFTVAFKALFHCSPHAFRRKNEFCPLQLKFHVDGNTQWRGDRIMDTKIVEWETIKLIGIPYQTRFGFGGIGRCWRKLHAKKGEIPDRADMDFLIGLNDYSSWTPAAEKQPAFSYYVAAEVHSISDIPKGMTAKILPAGKYVVFRFRANSQDSLQPVADYVYKEWFPRSTCRLNEDAKYDFAKYGELVDAEGKSTIEFWVPIL